MLSAWNSFYVMIGSSAAALTGLTFIVITLAGGTRRGTSPEGVATFSTPTVVHFSCPLFAAALMTAPFPSLVPVEVLLALAGAGGVGYVSLVAWRSSRLATYRPDAEDWTWHVGLPFAAYAAILGGAVALRIAPTPALYAPAAGVTLLIFIGVHNAWDVVTFLATDRGESLDAAPAAGERSNAPERERG